MGGVRRAGGVLGVVVALSVWMATAGTAGAAVPKGPTPFYGDCLGHTGPALCNWKVSFADFSLSRHVLKVGDTLTGSYSWGGFPYESYRVRFTTAGQGLRLIRCTPRARGLRTVGTAAQGRRTCTWRATAPTGQWVKGPSITLRTNTGTFPEEDYYAVIGARDLVIEGRVTRQNTERVTRGQEEGVPGVTIRVHGPQSRTARTDSAGFYMVRLTRSGRYRVTPSLPRAVGTAGDLTPRTRVVAVSRSRVGKADFRVDDDLTVRLDFDRTEVPATGREQVTGTITARRFGKPVPGLVVAVQPYGQTVSVDPQDPAEVPVPARFCVDGANRWPAPNGSSSRGFTGNVFPFDVTTDAAGRATFGAVTGVVPGGLRVQVWARDPGGALRTVNIARVRDSATVSNQAIPSSGRPLRTLLAEAAAEGRLTLAATDPASLAAELGSLGLGGFAFAPVRGGLMTGVLVYEPSQRFVLGEGLDLPMNSAGVLTPDRLDLLLSTTNGGFAGTVRSGFLPEPAPYAAWQAGQPVAGWNLVSQSGPVRLADDARSWRYLGYPYPALPGQC